MSEYRTAWLATYAFPHLFPYGRGDPFGYSPGHSSETANMKYRHLIQYCYQTSDGQWSFPFQEDQRFVLWLNNLKYRHMMNGQGIAFLKDRPDHANRSIEELRQAIALGNHNPVLQDLTRFIANIPGTPCYWKDACAGLLAIVECKKIPGAFLTFTYADHHDPYLLELLGIPANSSVEFIKQAYLNKSAIVETYFVKKFKIFREEVLVKLYGCSPDKGGWFWGRAEWQHRGILHFHLLVRFPDTMPDPFKLATEVIEGFNVRHTLWNFVGPKTAEQQRVLDASAHSTEELIRFHDLLLSSDVSESIEGYRPPVRGQQMPMNKKSTDILAEDAAQDLLNLVMVCNSHRVCRVGHCIKFFNNERQPCKFRLVVNMVLFKRKCHQLLFNFLLIVRFPKRLLDKTEVNCRMRRGVPDLEIEAKRHHSTRVNTHNTDFLRIWRANTDASLIHCLRRVIKYIAKYASKPEKKSNVCLDSYKFVFSRFAGSEITTHQALIKVMQRVLSERDVSVYEAVHQLLGIPLFESNIQVINTSLESGRAIARNMLTNTTDLKNNLLDTYKLRLQYASGPTEADMLTALNFKEFATRYSHTLKKSRKNSIVVYIIILIIVTLF